MRRARTAACALATVAVVGCGDADSGPKRRPQAVPSGEYGHPVKVQHSSGDTFVPAGARVVVTLTPGALDTTLSLGVRPVGSATDSTGAFPGYLARRAKGVKGVGPPYRLSLARIRKLDPELILGSKQRQGRLYGELRVIAPTVMSPPPGIGPGTPRQWKLTTRLYAEALGRGDQGEALLSRYDRLAARARGALGPDSRRLRVAAVEALPGGRARLAGLDSFAAAVLEDAGLRGPRPRGVDRPLAPGSASHLAADVVLLSAAPAAGSTLGRLRGALPGRVVVVPDQVWWRGEGPLASTEALRELRRALSRRG